MQCEVRLKLFVGHLSSQDVAELGVDFLVASSAFGKRHHLLGLWSCATKNLERSSFKFSNEHEGFHFCSPALQTWMLCFIYPQMTFTFMKSVVNESLMSLCHSWYFWYFELFLGPQVFSTWEFNFCSHVPFLSFSIHFSLVTQVTRCMAQPAWVSSGASPRSWRWVHTVDLFNGHIQQIPTNSNNI